MKDPLSSRPFSEEDVPRILSAADSYVKTWKGVEAPDPVWMGRFVRFILAFGPHISVLSGGWRHRTDRVSREIRWRYSEPLSSADLRLEGGQLYLAWRRPKTEIPILAPVPDGMQPWCARWLDAPRPRRRPRYWELLKDVEATIEGPKLLLTPSRFRHSAAVRLRKAGVPDEAIQELLGIAPATMRRYINLTTEQMTQDLRSRGLLA